MIAGRPVSPVWQRALARLRAGESILLHAPQGCRADHAVRYLLGDARTLGFSDCVYLMMPGHCHDENPDWGTLWAEVQRQLQIKQRSTITEEFEFRAALRRALTRGRRLLLVVSSAQVGCEAACFDIWTSIVRLLGEVAGSQSLTVLLLDDYTLYYYETWRTQGVSRWDFLHRLHLPFLTRPQVRDVLRTTLGDRPIPGDEAAARILEATGGHPGLVADIVEDLVRMEGPLPNDYWTEDVPHLLRLGVVLESVRRAMLEDPVGLSSCALEYEQPHLLRDYDNRAVRRLRQLGVLHCVRHALAQLAGGALREMVLELNETATRVQPLGPVVTAFGPRRFVSDPVSPPDDALVVVHMSDLHVGPEYAFRLRNGLGMDGKRSLSELVAEDVEAMNLDRRVDALVLSGDLTSAAGSDEFRRASEVVSDLQAALGLGRDRIVVTAGNHDMNWAPRALSRVEPLTRTSREEWETFRLLLGKDALSRAEVLRLPSRDGTRGLEIISVDSNAVEGPDAGGIGMVDLQELEALDRCLKDARDTTDRARWLVLHHHVLPVTSAQPGAARARKVSVMANAVDVLAWAERWQVELVLHGHEHQPSVTSARRWPTDTGNMFEPVVVAGAGSVGLRRDLGPFARNHYFVLIRTADELIIRSRMIGDGGLAWASHADIAVPCRRESGHAAAHR